MSDKKLATKLLNILDTMGGVPKKGYNKHQNYHYMREVDVMEALKDQLIKHKIIMLTSSKFVDIQKKDGKDKTEFVTTVETTHTFLDTETGETLPITSVGSGYDSSDKGASKAITASFKYAIMKTFMISDEGADIENDGQTQQAPVAKPAGRVGFNRSPQAAPSTPPVVAESKPEPITIDLGPSAPEKQTVTQQTTPNSSTQVTVTQSTLKTNTTVKPPPRFGSRPAVAKAEPKF